MCGIYSKNYGIKTYSIQTIIIGADIMNEQINNTTDNTCGMKFQSILNRVKSLLLTPDTAWDNIKNENESITNIYKNYLIVLAAITPFFNWFSLCVLGNNAYGITYRAPLFGSLIYAVLIYFTLLASVYTSALILEKLAPKFEGSTTLDNAFKLVAYASTPIYISGLFSLLPVIGTLASLAGAIYSIYLFFKGFPKFIQIDETKKITFIAASIACMFVANLLFFLIIMQFAPTDPASYLKNNNNNIDLSDFENKARQIQNILQKPQ